MAAKIAAPDQGKEPATINEEASRRLWVPAGSRVAGVRVVSEAILPRVSLNVNATVSPEMATITRRVRGEEEEAGGEATLEREDMSATALVGVEEEGSQHPSQRMVN